MCDRFRSTLFRNVPACLAARRKVRRGPTKIRGRDCCISSTNTCGIDAVCRTKRPRPNVSLAAIGPEPHPIFIGSPCAHGLDSVSSSAGVSLSLSSAPRDGPVPGPHPRWPGNPSPGRSSYPLNTCLRRSPSATEGFDRRDVHSTSYVNDSEGPIPAAIYGQHRPCLFRGGECMGPRRV